METDIEFYLDNVNRFANLQLLEGAENLEKRDTDFLDWLSKCCPSVEARAEYVERHFIPEVDLSIENFREFIEGRKSKMRERLREILGI